MTGPEEEIGLGDLVRILGSKVQGCVVAFTCSMRSEDRYLVEYVDASGNPQEREWSESQLVLVKGAESAALDGGNTTIADNIIPFAKPS